jgi:hypothetical protein
MVKTVVFNVSAVSRPLNLVFRVLTMEFLEKHQIDYVAHDDLPYPDTSGAADDVYAFVKQKGMFVATDR